MNFIISALFFIAWAIPTHEDVSLIVDTIKIFTLITAITFFVKGCLA